MIERLKKSILIGCLLMIFLVASLELGKLFLAYELARKEAREIRKEYTVSMPKTKADEADFHIDWEGLLALNPDVVGWIRFYPEPAQISYPILQGKDNEEYLHKSLKGEKSVAGSIFLHAGNDKDFEDEHSILFGHRMRDGSMFRHLADYEEEEFCRKYPKFYVYTPNGGKYTYQIFSVEIVTADSKCYETEFKDAEEYASFFLRTERGSWFELPIKGDEVSPMLTLSTCTGESDEHRLVVRGVRVGVSKSKE